MRKKAVYYNEILYLDISCYKKNSNKTCDNKLQKNRKIINKNILR